MDGTCITSSISILDSFETKERVSVNDSHGSIEFELFVPVLSNVVSSSLFKKLKYNLSIGA